MSGEEELRESVARLERRVEALEARVVSPHNAPDVEEKASFDWSLVGRALIVLGGAYLLRAITPDLIGVVLALAYAVFWIRKRSLHYSATGVFIALAVAWEGCVRFHLLDARIAAAILAAIAVGVLLIADKHLAWLAVCGASVALIALALGTRAVAPSAVAIVPVFVAAVWKGWPYLAFAPGIALDLMLIVLAGMTAIGKAPDARIAAAAIALFAMAATFSAFAWKRATLATFDAAQLFAVILIALTGTTVLLFPFTIARVSAGAFVLALAIASYMLRHATFTATAVLFVLFGTALAMDRELATIVWSAAALVAALAHSRQQAAAFASAAFVLSGLFVFSFGALFVSLTTPDVVMIVVFLALAISAALARPPHLLLITLAAFAAMAMILALAIPHLGVQPAALRTILLAAAALLASRFLATRALANPILIVGGIKLLVEDFRVGSPATLFVSLVVYGGALVMSRPLRSAPAPEPTPANGLGLGPGQERAE
jgi:hypothetical protein